ncbi:MAG: hypothetical protein KatS3mg052_0677 [Candidatus Roseilinea sp.]|nr:MAG: hypothetical protein KatS3mg052_0677 [Candidatus Roseilinea sp.]
MHVGRALLDAALLYLRHGILETSGEGLPICANGVISIQNQPVSHAHHAFIGTAWKLVVGIMTETSGSPMPQSVSILSAP